MKSKAQIEALAKALTALDVKVCGTIGEFKGYGDDIGLWVSMEEGALCMYAPDSDAYFESDIHQAIDEHGFFLELYDSGTGMIYEV